MKRFLFIATLIPFLAQAQTTFPAQQPDTPDSVGFVMLPYTVVGDDTVATFNFEEFDVNAMKEEIRVEWRVRKVWGYAQIVAALREKVDADLDTMTSRRQRKRYLKAAQGVLKVEFEDELKKLSVQQGRILMKLIYRETDRTAYDLVQQFRGGGTATFWQTAARLYGSSMKLEYHPDSTAEDAMIEKYAQRIEDGKLQPYKRKAKTKTGQEALSERQKRRAARREERRERRRKRKEERGGFHYEELVDEDK